MNTQTSHPATRAHGTAAVPARLMALRNFATIATTELKLIIRSKSVLISATLFPLAIGAIIIAQRDAAVNAATSITLFAIAIFSLMTVFMTLTVTLVTRRQELYLKRLRSGEASSFSILAGLTAPPVLLGLAQLVIVLGAGLIVGMPVPERPWLVVLGTVAAFTVAVAAAFATAVFTPNPSAAQISTVPFLFGFFGTMVGVEFVSSALWDLTPGGALVTICRYATAMPTEGALWSAVAGMLIWIAVGFELARRYFRWEPRS